LRSHKTILVVDDQVAIRRAIELKFSIAGYQVISAADGEAALELIRSRQPDAVIADITMPRLDGRTLCEMTDGIKKDRPFLTVMVTARISPDERQWIQQMRDTLFMEKPFSPTRLLEAVDNYLGVSA
jgi:CheY-like chemotaxis protein